MRVLLVIMAVAMITLMFYPREAPQGASPSFIPVISPSPIISAKSGIKDREPAQSPPTAQEAHMFTKNLFTEGKIIAEQKIQLDEETVQLIKIVETETRFPLVRVEEIYKGKGSQISQTAAMVANQLMLLKPESVTYAAFVEIIRDAGGVEVKKISESVYLVTFRFSPRDALALDNALAKIRESSGGQIISEKNYIRKLI